MSLDLTSSQLEAIQHPGEKLQVIACAGSGKTEVLARRVVHLLSQGADPASVIAFTYTKKAASELKDRIETRAAEEDETYRELPPVARGMYIGTSHAWASSVLSDLGGRYELMDALTEEQEWALLLRVARRLGVVDLYANSVANKADKVATAPAIGEFIRNVEVVYNEQIDRNILEKESPEFLKVLQRYERLLDDMCLMPFRSMIEHAARELEAGGKLREKLQDKIKYVLVDEFQDFNKAQYRLLKNLMALGTKVTVVGDDDQAIYQWRGGDVSLFNNFDKVHPNVDLHSLNQNHRCRPEIVNFASVIPQKFGDSREKSYESSRESSEHSGIELVPAETPDQEAAAIAQRIKKLIDEGQAPGDIAVLYRSVRNSSEPLIRELKRREIPFAIVGKTSMLNQREILLIIHIFVLWDIGSTWYPRPRQSEFVSREMILNEIHEVTGAGPEKAQRMLGRLESLGKQIREDRVGDIVRLYGTVLQILGLPVAGKDKDVQEHRLGKLSALLSEFDDMIRRAVPASFYAATEKGASEEAEEDRLLTADETEVDKDKANVLGLTRGELYLKRLKSYFEAFVTRSAEETPDNDPSFRDAVQIMTIHQSKGLQFPIVFIPCLVDGRFPVRGNGKQDNWYVPVNLFDPSRYEGRMDDEGRLFYVAITRARELVVISWFNHYKNRKAKVSELLSRYVVEAMGNGRTYGSLVPMVSEKTESDELLDVSFSSLTTFMECAYRYWLRHVCGFRSPRVPELGFGKILHHVIAELARESMDHEESDSIKADQVLDGSFYLPYAGPIPAELLRKTARKRIHHYVQNYGNELLRTYQPEFMFEVPL